ncbi:uncharacterized protein LOC122997305 [Thunnus albacares]|uniref:uncharacterized protein LOC122997305 n=1 Tax=Thunnus albacares TaxID=8236 RepID=UPI001CF61026|nr:uncharacterized protein LOC122997305 [Thunnus albacares]
MEKLSQPTWMQTVTCLNALKSDDDKYSACNLTKVLGERLYVYYPASNISELDRISSPPSSAFSESGPSNATPGPAGLHKLEPVSRSADSSLLVKAPCRLKGDVEALMDMSRSTEVTESSWILRTLQKLTFSSSYLDPYTYQGCETVGRRYLYAPLSEISGFVDEGFPPCTRVHPDGREPEVSTLESEGLVETSCCTAAAAEPLLVETDEPPVF